MLIRHVVAWSNVDPNGVITSAERARHAVIVAGRIFDLAGEVDPLTHLNLDYPQHRLAECIVAERLERGAAVICDGNGPIFAYPASEAYRRRGPVDLGRRRGEWLARVRRQQTE